MCPACIAASAWIAFGTASTGLVALAALLLKEKGHDQAKDERERD